MLRLTLIRHAEAEPARAGLEDWQRALSPNGQREAREMGQRLNERHLYPDKMLTSPAERAWLTAVLIARELGASPTQIERDERLYLASPGQMLAVLQERGGDAAHLMVFGHNPGIAEFAARLSSGRSIDGMPTCAVYTLVFGFTDWRELAWASGADGELDHPRRPRATRARRPD